MRMAEQPGGELGEEIDVFVPVEVPKMRPLALRHRQRKRIDKDRGSRVAAGQRGAGRFVLRQAFRVARAIELLRLGKRGGNIDIGWVRRAHRLSFERRF